MRTPDTTAILSLIDTIYAAGLEPGRWETVASHIARLVPGAGCGIHAYTPDATQFGFSVGAGYEPRTLKEFTEVYGAHDPWARTMLKQPVAKLVVIDQHPDGDVNRHTQFQADFIVPHNLGSGVGLKLLSDERHLFWISIDYAMRQSARLDAKVAALAATVAPHMVRAFEINRLRRTTTALELTLAGLVEHIAQPAIVVDARLQLRKANAAAHDALRRGRGISLDRQDRLTLADVVAADALSAAVSQACASSVIPFRTAGDQAAHTILLAPFTADASLAVSGGFEAGWERLFLLILRYDGEHSIPDAGLLRQLFRLTPAEAQLAAALAEGLGIAQIAAARGVREDTVRSQLKSLFEKTGTSRQGELVARLLGAGKSIPLK